MFKKLNRLFQFKAAAVPSIDAFPIKKPCSDERGLSYFISKRIQAQKKHSPPMHPFAGCRWLAQDNGQKIPVTESPALEAFLWCPMKIVVRLHAPRPGRNRGLEKKGIKQMPWPAQLSDPPPSNRSTTRALCYAKKKAS